MNKQIDTIRHCSYIRVSTRRQGESGLGLESQQDIINHMYPTCEKEFCDIASGGTADRVELKKAVEFCKTTGAYLVVAKADRLSRDVRDALGIYEQINGRLQVCNLPKNPDKFILTLFFAIASLELENISIRIRGALERKRKRGELTGTKLTVSKKGNPLDVKRLDKLQYKQAGGDAMRILARNNENNIRALGYARSLREQGTPYLQIASQLNSQQFKSPKGKQWQAGSVCRLLNR